MNPDDICSIGALLGKGEGLLEKTFGLVDDKVKEPEKEEEEVKFEIIKNRTQDEQVKALMDARSQASPEFAKVMDEEMRKIVEMTAIPSFVLSGPKEKIKEIADRLDGVEEERVVTCKDNYGIEGWFNNDVDYVFKGYQGFRMEVYDLKGEARVVDSVRFSAPRIDE